MSDNGIRVVNVLNVRRFRVGYDIRDEIWAHGNELTRVKAAYSPDGHYIGSSRDAYRLVAKRGIAPELREPTHSVCSIGYAKRTRQWYGWSHRAIFGFGVGSVVTTNHCAAESLPVGFKAKTLADAKRIAVAFAESVS